MNRPPGPENGFTLDELRQRNLLELFPDLVKEYGNVVYWEVDGIPNVLVNEPDLIDQVMVRDHARFTKGSLWWIKAVMGEGVGVSEGKVHRRQRRMMAPAFALKRVESYAPDMVDLARRHAMSWQPGVQRPDRILGDLNLAIVHRTLLGCELNSEEAREIRGALTIAKKSSGLMAAEEAQVPPAFLAEFKAAMARLDGALLRLLEARRNVRGRDILSHLMTLHDDHEQGFSDHELRDQAMSILLAGHDTTSDALAWTFQLLAQHPEIQHLAAQEALALGRDPVADDVPRLDLCRRIFEESMRLYPPIWVISRMTTGTYDLGPYEVAAGTYVRMSPLVTHRDARYFPDPERFDPDRWQVDEARTRPRYAYFPFGGGQRVCLGESMARLEGPLLIATILRRWKFHHVADVKPLAYITLSAHDLHLRLEAR